LLYSALWASGKDREREMVLRRAQWKYPSDYWINHRLGVDLIWRRKPDDVREGIGFMRAALALRPQSIHALLNLGNGYFFLGQYDQAIACYRKMIEISPNSWVGFASLGGSLVRKGLYDEAIAALEQALKKSISAPYSAGVYVDLSMIHSSRPEVHLRNASRAAEFAEKAIQIEPQASNHWTALGIARYRQSRWQEARTALEKALELGTDSWGGTHRWPDAIDWFFLAMSNWQLGQTDQARQCYGRAVQWMEKAQPWEIDIEELARFRTEAENLLAVPGSTTR
jgi:tetratricopeptide (TPR) repeat protein